MVKHLISPSFLHFMDTLQVIVLSFLQKTHMLGSTFFDLACHPFWSTHTHASLRFFEGLMTALIVFRPSCLHLECLWCWLVDQGSRC